MHFPSFKIICLLIIPVMGMEPENREMDEVTDHARSGRFGFGGLQTLHNIWSAVCNKTCNESRRPRFFGSSKLFCALKCPDTTSAMPPTEITTSTTSTTTQSTSSSSTSTTTAATTSTTAATTSSTTTAPTTSTTTAPTTSTTTDPTTSTTTASTSSTTTAPTTSTTTAATTSTTTVATTSTTDAPTTSTTTAATPEGGRRAPFRTSVLVDVEETPNNSNTE